MSIRSSTAAYCHPEQSEGSLRVLCAVISILILASCGVREPAPDTSGPLSVHAQLSTNRLYVGDVFELHVRVNHPAGSTIRLPELSRPKELVVRNQTSRQSMPTDDLAMTETQYRLSSFALGQHIISTGTVVCITAEGELLEAPFPFAAFEVMSALAGADEPLRDIKDVAHWPGAIPRWIWGLLLIAILAIVAGLLSRHFRTKPRTILHHPPPEPPHEIALRRLRALKSKGWIESLNVEPFYVEVSGIVRQYIENRFRLRAPEMTTEEFIRAASESRHLNEDQQKLTADFLEQSDLVKFARYAPGKEDMGSALHAAERLVVETMPKTESSDAGGDA